MKKFIKYLLFYFFRPIRIVHMKQYEKGKSLFGGIAHNSWTSVLMFILSSSGKTVGHHHCKYLKVTSPGVGKNNNNTPVTKYAQDCIFFFFAQ